MATTATAKPAVKPTAKPAAPAKAAPLKTPVNVKVLLMKDDWLIHEASCKRYAADKRKSQYSGFEDYEIAEIVNQREVILEVWDEQIREAWAEDEKNADKDYAEATWGWLAKNGFVHTVKFHTCLDGLPQLAKTSTTKTANSKKAAKNELATLVAEAAGAIVNDILEAAASEPDSGSGEAAEDSAPLAKAAQLILAGFESPEAVRQCVAQWLHGMPVDRARFLRVLPRPDRSDWRSELDAANSAPATTAPEDTSEEEEEEGSTEE